MSAEALAAVHAGRADELGRLLKDGADPDTRDPGNGLTLLMIAAGRGDLASVTTLLDAGADVLTAEPGAGASTLHKAIQGGSLDVVRALVEAGAFVDAVAPTTGHTPLMDALWFKWPDIAGYLLDQGAGLNLSTHYGFTLKEHFAYELNVNTHGKDRLIEADRLLKARSASDEAQAAEQLLMAAVVAGDLPEVKALLSRGVEVDARYPRVNGFNDGHTPLLVAARDGHREIVRELLAAGADVNAVEPVFGAVPLHKAVYNGHADITRLLIEHGGCDLNFQGATNGYSPLHDSLWHGYAECAQVLLDAGARTDLVGHDGKTPRDIAVETFGADHPLVQQTTPIVN
ncbi:ankyrin repeat domain-containing protein [Streptosporangium sp. NPDC000396]|uniref:ankyrin repeat domain-containing protein n=1 Tax=Streptosporangium sp. NPDC000396 TaxID=3366185 RepID=UPI0036C7C343